jgi:hypothetical protein
VGIWLNTISDIICDYPKENICHIRVKSERLFDSVPQVLNPRELFDFNDSVSEEKVQNIEVFLSKYFCPALNNLKSIDCLIKLYKEAYFKYAYIEKNARILLSS